MTTSTKAVSRMTAQRIIHRLSFTWRRTRLEGTISEDGTSLLIDVVDPTGPNGMRTFIVTCREV
jgi:hypothetical protein